MLIHGALNTNLVLAQLGFPPPGNCAGELAQLFKQQDTSGNAN
jgi:hypothetical protein